MKKNVSGQKWRVFAFNRLTNAPVTGDAANITAKIDKDYAGRNALTDTSPTETEDGYYLFDLAQAESNADVLDIYPESATPNVQVVGVPGTIYTTFPQTGDGYALANGASGFAAIKNQTAAIEADTQDLQTQVGVDGAGLTQVGLASTGLDNIAADVPNGVASTFRGRLMQLWARFFYRHRRTAAAIETYRADGSTLNTTQPYTSGGSVDNVEGAS